MKIRGIEIKDMFYYIQGNIRYELYYSKFRWLIPKYIREQITYRINSMDIACYEYGSCMLCGCKTTALQMCNKACDKPCYPKMISKRAWFLLTNPGKINTLHIEHELVKQSWAVDTKNLRFVKKWNGREQV